MSASGLLPVAVGVPLGIAGLYGICLACAHLRPHLPHRTAKPAPPERPAPVAQPRTTEPYEAGGMAVGAADTDRYQEVPR